MNKNFFWISSVFLIALNIFLFNNQNYLALSIVLILSCSFIGFKFNKLFLKDNANQAPPPPPDLVEVLILTSASVFFLLSRFFSEYELELLGVTILLGFARIIRINILKKKKACKEI